MKLDWFKLSLLLCVVIFLFLYSQSGSNGRYIQFNNSVIDTKTGAIYAPSIDSTVLETQPVKK